MDVNGPAGCLDHHFERDKNGVVAAAQPALCHLSRVIDQADVNLCTRKAIVPWRNHALPDEYFGDKRFNGASIAKRGADQAARASPDFAVGYAVHMADVFQRGAQIGVGTYADNQRGRRAGWLAGGRHWLEQGKVGFGVRGHDETGAIQEPAGHPQRLTDLRLCGQDMPATAVAVRLRPRSVAVQPWLAVALAEGDATRIDVSRTVACKAVAIVHRVFFGWRCGRHHELQWRKAAALQRKHGAGCAMLLHCGGQAMEL